MEQGLDLLKRAKDGDKEAKEQFIEKNLGLVGSVVKRFEGRIAKCGSGKDFDREDLFQIGTIGLIKAVNKFDFNFDVCFSTYAVPLIIGEIRRFLRDDGPIKISRTLKEQGFAISKAREVVEKREGRSATMEEISAETGFSVEEIALALDANREVGSLSQKVYESDGSSISIADSVKDPSNRCLDVLNHVLVEQLMQELNPKEQELIRRRFFLDQTQNQVAAALAMTQVSVSRLEKKILLKLRSSVVQ